jgi:hypothetical protein
MNFDPTQIPWRGPWRVTTDEEATKLQGELQRETIKGHVLFGRSVTVVGRRSDNDDVLFYLGDAPPRFAVVHLTYRQENDPAWPHTVLYDSLESWVDRCMARDLEE